MDENAYKPPGIPSDRPPPENPFHSPHNRLLIAAVFLIPLLAWIAMSAIYVIGETIYER